MSITWYRTAGVLSAVAIAAAGGFGTQAGWGHLATDGRTAAYRVLGSGEGPASVVTVPSSGEGPAVTS